MTTRKSARKKTNLFEELGKTVPNTKDPDLMEEPSSITKISATKIPDQDTDLKEVFLAFQASTNTKFDKIKTSFFDINYSFNSLHHSFTVLLSRQNSTNKHSPPHIDRSTHSLYDKPSHTNDKHENDPQFSSSTNNDIHHEPTDGDDYTTDCHQHQNIALRGTLTATAPHRFWKIVCDDNLEPHRFQSLVKGIILQDDTMQSLCHFYNKIRHTMHTSFKKHVDILPTFGGLSTIPNITHLLLPNNPDYAGYSLIKSVYDWFSDSVTNILFDQDVINNKRIPQAHRIIITHDNINDGWNLLFILLSKRCPFLGGKSLDVATEITMLKLNQNDTIHTFFNESKIYKLNYAIVGKLLINPVF